MGEWQDIASAPKDGRKVDLWCGRRICDARYGRLGWQKGDWVADRRARTYPTHWMPLPAPPEALEGDQL